jgi:hypothetical protein
LVKNFLAKNNVPTLKHPPPPNFPGLAPPDFYLFPRLKSALQEQHFCDATDIIKNVMEKLKRLSENGFQECFQHICCRWQNCVVAQGDYFEGNVA